MRRGLVLLLLARHAARALGVAFASDGLLASCSHDGSVLLWR